jgi:glutamate/tyrosine decarboxylase-like PLP-dependent enzyme
MGSDNGRSAQVVLDEVEPVVTNAPETPEEKTAGAESAGAAPLPTEPGRIPARGVDGEALLRAMDGFRQKDADWEGGRTWSMVYHAGREHHDLMEKAASMFLSANALNPMAFQSLKRMESEVVRMALDLLNAPEDAVGVMTSGGTESILLAVKAYRDYAKKRWPWILKPEIVMPSTVHVAFDKAAHYFGLKIRYVEVDGDYRAVPKKISKAIGANTVLVVASAPQYPHGTIDPIAEIGAIAEKRGVPFHVDACVGGFMLPWIERLGHAIPTFDFRVPGVTSMSADVHKYGYAPKGASVVLYRSMTHMRHQFFVSTDWSGGIYASPGIAGSRPGGPIASAWASLMALGEEGFLRLTKQALETAERLRAGIREISGLKLLGLPHATIVSYASTEPKLSMFAIADQLEQKGWSVDRQQRPDCIHLTVNAQNAPVVDQYLADLRAAVEHVRAHPELAREGEAAMYGLMSKAPVKGFVDASVRKVMEVFYGPKGETPDLGSLGEGEDDGLLLRLMHQYGDQAAAWLDKLGWLRRLTGGRP